MSLVERFHLPRSSLRARLFWLVAVCVLPLIGTSSVLLYQNYELRREHIEQNTLLLARKVMSDLERELAAIEAGLKVLATSSDLEHQDFKSFHQRASQALASGIVRNYILTDANGHQVVNTLVPFGSDLPQRGTPAQLAQVFSRQQTVLTDLFVGPVTGQPVLAMGVPVQVNGQIRYSLNIGLQPLRLNELLKKQQLPEGWLIAILDQSGTIVGRSRDAGRFVGHKAVSPLVDALSKKNEGYFETLTKEGIPVFTAHVKSSQWNWGVAVGAPVNQLHRQLVDLLLYVSLATLIAFAVGVVFALQIAKRVLSSIKGLNQAAVDLCEGRAVVLPKLQWDEASAIGTAILRAAELMGEEKFRAQHDTLTGLANRALLQEIAYHQLAQAKRNSQNVAMVLIDLDGFKAVNDTDGHAIGDAVLKTTARRLLDALRASDTAARIGGDEFAVLLVDVDATEALCIIDRVISVLGQAFPETRCSVSASAGIALFPTHGMDFKALIEQADHALYRAKRAGKNRVFLASSSAEMP